MSYHTGSTFETCLEVTQALCEIVDSPRSLAVSLLMTHEEWDQLLDLDISPDHYLDWTSFKDDYLVTKVMSKHPEIPSSYDRPAEALKSFYEGEDLCRHTNSYMFDLSLPIIDRVQKEIYKVIGFLSRRDLNFIEDRVRHGPGATFCLTGTGSVPSDKFRTKQPTVTWPAAPFVRSLMGPEWADWVSSFTVVEGNRFTTVPKTSKTDRGICIEPLLNVYAQLGIGTVLKDRLKRHGCDLYDQTRNQLLAAKARDWELATIDLSLASDTLSCSLVYRLLPARWFELLDTFRSHITRLPDGKKVILEKFSSMGNGFTFELESLIFFSICKAIVPSDEHHLIGVYGDDIIVPRKYASEVITCLETFGFKANSSKTHLAGEYFESCGMDFFSNKAVRPFFLRTRESASVPFLVQVLNKLRVYSSLNLNGFCDSRFRELWVSLYKKLDTKTRKCLVPRHYGDVGIIVSQLEAPKARCSFGLEDVFKTSVFRIRPVTRRYDDPPVLWAALLGSPQFTYGRESVRGYLGRRKIVRTTVWWPDGFEWI